MKRWVTGILLATGSALASASECANPANELVHVHAQQNDGAYSLAADQKLMLFYKTPLQAESFQATLNGEDISNHFSPSESKFGEVLALELKQGENLLELSAVVRDSDCAKPTEQRIRLFSKLKSTAEKERVASIAERAY